MRKLLLFITAIALCVGAKATELWQGTCTIKSWEGSNVTVDKEHFSGATAGNIIRVSISTYAEKDDSNNEISTWTYQLQQKDNKWQTLTDFTGGDLRKGQKCVSYVLTENDVTTLKEYGLAINGQWITITKVELLTSSVESLSTTETSIGSNWGNYELTWGNKGGLANAQKYDCIRVTYTVTAEAAQININTVFGGGWVSRAYKYDNSYDAGGTNTGKILTATISDASILEMVQQAGIAISAVNMTITAVDLIKPNDRIDVVPLAIGSDGIATFGSSKHLDFTDTGVTPYYATTVTPGSVTLTSTDKTRAWSGCIVKGTRGDYEIPVTSEVNWESYMSNLISTGENGKWVYRSVYSDYAEEGNEATSIRTKHRYIFAKNGSDIGFFKIDSNYSRTKDQTTVYYHELAAHKAYLETSTNITPTDNNAPIMLIFSDTETTGISDTENKVVTDNAYYNLNGMRVANPTKGLYIVNGKKVVIQ